MLSCEDVRSVLSDFYDDIPDSNEKTKIAHHLAQCPECAMEYRSFVRTLDVIRAIPDEEPVLDLWMEFSAKMDVVRAEEKQSLLIRLQRNWRRALAHFSEGAILYTTFLAQRTTDKLSRHLIRDPFSINE